MTDAARAGDGKNAAPASASAQPVAKAPAKASASSSGVLKPVAPTKASASSSGVLRPVGQAPAKASASSSGTWKPQGHAPDSASATSSGLLKALKKTDTASASSSGLTVMVITQSGHKAKRMNIPRWLIFAAAFAWLSLMVAAFVWGFESAAPKRGSKSPAAQSKIDRTAMGPSPSSRQK